MKINSMMKTTYRYVAALFALLMGLAACDEREPEAFKQINGIYFNNRSAANALLPFTDVTFVYVSGDEMQVPVKIQLLGRPSQEVRPIDIRVTSSDAEEGVDYMLPAVAELPAGASSLDYIVTLKRTEALKTVKKSISLELAANDYFTLPVDSEVQAGGESVTYKRFQIFFSDMFTSAPTAWEEDLIGPFTQQKFELICKVLTVDPADFNDSSVMTYAMQMFIHSEMTEYVKEQVKKRENGEEYDEKAFDNQGEPLTF